MRLQIAYKGLEKQDKETLKKIITEKATELEAKLGSLANKDISLRGTLEKSKKHNRFRFGATMHLPHKMIVGEEEGGNALDVINKAFSELDRQAQKYKSRLKQEHVWKRVSRRKKLKSKTIEAKSVSSQPVITTSAGWFENIKPYLDDLYHFAIHEITYLQAIGDLTPDDMLPDELVDAVIVFAFEQQNKKPENLDTKAWLYQLAIDILDKEIESSQSRRQQISLETVIADEDIDTTIYEFYQPDEVLKLEDLIGVSDSLAEKEKEQALKQQTLAQLALAGLPRNWRRAAVLRHALGFPTEQVATIMRLEQAAIEDILEIAARFIAERTSHSGLPEGVQIERLLQVTVKKVFPQTYQDELCSKFTEE